MNKKLLAVAVAGALAAPGLALAQASNVQIYGAFDMSAQINKFSGPGTTPGAGNGNFDVTKNNIFNGASRWGIRGTEDLGNGLRAFFQAEAGMFPDARPDSAQGSSGVGFLGGRNTAIGLQSSWGDIRIGMWDAPYKQVMDAGVSNASGAFTTFGMIMGNGDSTGAMPSTACDGIVSAATGAGPAAGTSSTVAGAAGAGCLDGVEGSRTSFHRRLAKTVQYWSPVWSGFQFKIATQMNNYKSPSSFWSTAANGVATAATSASGNNPDPSLWSYSLAWSGGPFSAYGAYETHRGFNITTISADVNAKDTGMQLGGKWNFGMGTVSLQWERLKYGDVAGTGALALDYKLTNWALGATFKIGGNGNLWGSYSKTPGRSNCGAAYNRGSAVVGADDLCGNASGANFVAIGYDHSMSKRTALYAAYGKITNNSTTNSLGTTVGAGYYYIAGPAGTGNGGSVSTVAAGVDVTTYAVGIKHTF